MANFSKKKITTLILTLIKSTVLIKKIKRATIGEKVFQKKKLMLTIMVREIIFQQGLISIVKTVFGTKTVSNKDHIIELLFLELPDTCRRNQSPNN